ncbi:MAG: methylenetetrahydrofolate reductase C-terminal domain-containing protein [Ancalomicrobiaceae bacterium]|nr:methylenetetrahydrofolate reductase C-terminal domain-containing protein [Ancalomicrobiaceae bacterium]
METPAAFEPRGRRHRRADRFALRFVSIRHARALETLYSGFERLIVAAAPLLARLGWERLERPVAYLERQVKGALFDCRMCGQCVLSSTGMSCPMNCPKGLRNGPCGGVRADGCCEVYADMPCVWVKAYEGSLKMVEGARIAEIQAPVDHRLKGRSSWLAVMRQKSGLGTSPDRVPAKTGAKA